VDNFSAEKIASVEVLSIFERKEVKNFSPSTSTIFSLKRKTSRGGEGSVGEKIFRLLWYEGAPQRARAGRSSLISLLERINFQKF